MKILLTGGGTGGHIYPALAFINYMKEKQPETEFLYVGAERGMETKLVPQQGIPFKTIKIQGFRRSLSPENFKTVYLFLKSIKEAKKILRTFQPDVVIGTGGYVSGSVVFAAHQLKIPTIIHEQNSVPGMTNKFLSRYATKVATCFEEAAAYFPKEKVVLTGNPRAQELADLQASDGLAAYQLAPEKRTVVIFGGSLGALKINQAFEEAYPILCQKEYQVLYGSGERYYGKLMETLGQQTATAKNVVIRPYIDQMAQVLKASDLMVGRAGATSIAEFTALGMPAILIPSPYVTNDHQTKNAQALVNNGAALLIPDQELTGEKLVAAIDQVLADEENFTAMCQASLEMGIADAAERLAKIVQEIR